MTSKGYLLQRHRHNKRRENPTRTEALLRSIAENTFERVFQYEYECQYGDKLLWFDVGVLYNQELLFIDLEQVYPGSGPQKRNMRVKQDKIDYCELHETTLIFITPGTRVEMEAQLRHKLLRL